MKLFIGGRQTGKTTKIVEWLLQSDDRFVLSAHGRGHYDAIVREVLERKYADLTPAQRAGKAERALTRVHTVGGTPLQGGGGGRQEWMVDDLDALLARLVRSGTVVGATHGPELTIQGINHA